MERVIEEFEVVDEGGSVYAAVTIQEFRLSRTMDGDSWIAGLKRNELADGRKLTYADANEFRVVQTWQLVRRRE
ncbi:MAG: hypothetical protein JNL41_08040 [Phenylobacterium sp.]|uniref:hypothetical protein n=1 Tax=Phenylobacterium sp. TaxID=1871053 RepID=UPI001A424922|nr:hypothetical protein [Phenylobacterium sp.]MBL8554213.1 hypothetical protein [Phenylobacterium sp.]